MYFLYSHFKHLVNIKMMFSFFLLFQILLFFNELQAVFFSNLAVTSITINLNRHSSQTLMFEALDKRP